MRASATPGTKAQYRLVLKSMRLSGLPESIQIGRVSVHQDDGPIGTQRTHVVQAPGWRPIFHKQMDTGLLEVAHGYRLTIASLDVELVGDLSAAFGAWRDECLAAVGALAVLLDERVAQQVLAEDLIVQVGSGEKRTADMTPQVRTFTPWEKVVRSDRPALVALASLDPGAESHVNAAARWYLRAVQSGVRPDAIVFFWIALESLSKPPYTAKRKKKKAASGGKKLTDVQWVEHAAAQAGVDLNRLPLSVGQLADLRAAVVHGGVEAPANLRDGYYTLEVLVRAVLRHALRLPPGGFPLSPRATRLREPLASLLEVFSRRPKTVWHEPPS